MKIVHLIGYFQPELGYKEYYIALNQVRAGHEVHVITSNKFFPFPDYQVMAKRLDLPASRKRQAGESVFEGIKIHRLAARVEIKESIFAFGVKEALAKIKPDIVHTYAPNQGLTLLGARYKDELGYFLIGDDQIQPESNKPYKSVAGFLRYFLFQKYANSYYYKKADVIFCPNNGTKEYLQNNLQVPESKLKLVPIGFDPKVFFFSQKAREEIRKRFAVNTKEFLILLVGRLAADKGFEVVLKAGADLIKSGQAKVLVVGEGDYKADLEALTQRLGLSKQVHFAGFVKESDLYQYYSAGDLAVWPKRPTVGISNAIGCFLPVLLPKNNFVDHLVAFENGLTFKADDGNDLEEKLAKIITDKELYLSLKKKTQKARQYFDFEKLALEDIRAYEEFAAAHPKN
ncbi:MAG: glycosyltransferase [bacterium]|nr:glycosyltransferase [bacterium]